MSATNNEILTGFYNKLIAGALGYDLAVPAVDFTPPAEGYWLELNHFPNRGRDEGLAYDSSFVPEGIIQVNVFGRPGVGIIQAGNIVEQVLALFPKGETLSGSVRVIRQGYSTDRIDMEDRFMIPVVFEYLG